MRGSIRRLGSGELPGFETARVRDRTTDVAPKVPQQLSDGSPLASAQRCDRVAQRPGRIAEEGLLRDGDEHAAPRYKTLEGQSKIGEQRCDDDRDGAVVEGHHEARRAGDVASCGGRIGGEGRLRWMDE